MRCFQTIKVRGRVFVLTALTAVAIALYPQDLQAAVESDSAAVEDPAEKETGDGRRTLRQFPKNLLQGASGVFHRDNQRPLTLGGSFFVLGLVMDHDTRDWIADERDQVSEFANNNLGPVGLGAAVVGLFIGGRFSDNHQFRDMTYDLGDAVIVNLGYSGLLKAAVSRDRPNDSGSDSFPSGHTSNAFAFATVVSQHYGKKIGIPAYTGAALIGASRLRSNAHWLSDVVAGATLGHIVGRSVVRQNSRGLVAKLEGRKNISVLPSIGPDIRAVTVTMSF